MSFVQRGMENHKNVMTSPSKPAWRTLCQPDNNKNDIAEDDSDLEEIDEGYERYNPDVILPSSMPEIESITNMAFDLGAHFDRLSDLFQHPDGST